MRFITRLLIAVALGPIVALLFSCKDKGPPAPPRYGDCFEFNYATYKHDNKTLCKLLWCEKSADYAPAGLTTLWCEEIKE